MKTLEQMKRSYLICRAYGHSWDPQTVKVTTNSRGEPIEYRSHLHCVRCGTVRVQKMTPRGDLGGNRYQYAEGYLQPRNAEDRFVRQDVRVEFINRALVEVEAS